MQPAENRNRDQPVGIGKVLRYIIEAGALSVWVKTALENVGHEVLVANPRKIALIYGNNKKNDKVDAENLARLGRIDRELLAPVKLRSLESLSDISILRARDLFVSQRTELINHVRPTRWYTFPSLLR